MISMYLYSDHLVDVTLASDWYLYICVCVWTLMLPPRGKTPGRNFSLCWICLGPDIRILVFCVLHICIYTVYTAYSFGREMLRDCKCPIVSQLRITHAHMYIIHTTICTCHMSIFSNAHMHVDSVKNMCFGAAGILECNLHCFRLPSGARGELVPGHATVPYCWFSEVLMMI